MAEHAVGADADEGCGTANRPVEEVLRAHIGIAEHPTQLAAARGEGEAVCGHDQNSRVAREDTTSLFEHAREDGLHGATILLPAG